jgi:hypothetical protein
MGNSLFGPRISSTRAITLLRLSAETKLTYHTLLLTFTRCVSIINNLAAWFTLHLSSYTAVSDSFSSLLM